MNMNLREFLANNSKVQEKFSSEIRASKTTQKVLGISWDATNDTTSIECKFMETPKITKRAIARQIASIYDPLGWLVPLLIPHKCFQQKLWLEGYSWDEELSPQLCKEWQTIREGANEFQKTFNRELSVETPSNIVVFADASEHAMAACAYIISERSSSLLMAKSKLPSIKSKMTIPKLEMNALTMAVRLARSVCEAVRSSIESLKTIFILSDSQIVLNWIGKSPEKDDLGVLVRNRIKEIQKIIRSINEIGMDVFFGYVPTEKNSADVGTRGVSKDELYHHDWWTGPSFLQQPVSSWDSPLFRIHDPLRPVHETEESFAFSTIHVEGERNSQFSLSRYSTLIKSQRIIGWILRFIRRSMEGLPAATTEAILKRVPELRKTATSGPLTGLEMRYAKQALIRNHQLSVLSGDYIKSMNKTLKLFQDSEGIWRARGRLGKSSLCDSAKFPIFIPPKSELASKIISNAHGEYHRGVAHTMSTVREEFWIPKLRQQARTVVRRCVRCKRFNGLPYIYPEMSDMPTQRVQKTRPFANIGLDFFDLPQIKEGDVFRKAYGCIFTCAVTRMIHLEVLRSMGTGDFLNALRRFFSRRGVPSLIICDNAPTFALSAEILSSASREGALTDMLSSHAIEWKNITPYAPWQGGFYERLIKSIKHALYKSIGQTKLSFDSLTTVITEIEATLNTRPLTYQESDCDEFASIRPIDFSQSSMEVTFPFSNADDMTDPDYHPSTELASLETRKQAVEALQSSIKITERFWNIWQEQYLSSLREHHRMRVSQNRSSPTTPKKGAVVLISDPVLPRNNWRMARITDTKRSSDGAIREVELTTSTRTKIRRPVNLIIPLELEDNDNRTRKNSENDEGCEKSATREERYNFRPRKNINYNEDSLATTTFTSSPGFSLPPKFSLLILTLLALCSLSFSMPIVKTLSMECHKNGVLVKNANTADFEICIEDECKLYTKPSLQEIVRFSPERTLHEHNVLLKWKTNETLTSMEMTCQPIDFCENIQCIFCLSVLLNPECWPLGALVGSTLLIYIIVALVYILLYVPITIGKPPNSLVLP
ncbi:integrase core domain protein [Ancylostoma ceylanicum]|uniref:Integrase core domain protein n=1 Tax=Ancylostoma ceylanicum TaxID=53326 RepID=A0A0D6L8C7_9BILA|nr:integrase core domain protein [Ancylostoma ceylanicum]